MIAHKYITLLMSGSITQWMTVFLSLHYLPMYIITDMKDCHVVKNQAFLKVKERGTTKIKFTPLSNGAPPFLIYSPWTLCNILRTVKMKNALSHVPV